VARPLATVVIGGLITSTLLTLLVLPTLYATLAGWVHRRHLDVDEDEEEVGGPEPALSDATAGGAR
jgi:hypothetical protein